MKAGKTKAGTPYTERHIASIKTIHKDHLEGLEWIMLVACGIGEETFSSDPQKSAYLQGRRAVALDIAELLKLKPAKEGKE